MPTAFLVVSIIGLLFTLNAFRPPRLEVFSIVTFFAGWLTSELPLHHLAWQALATLVFAAGGALDGWQGWLGLALTALSWCGLLILARMGLAAGSVVDDTLRQAGVDVPTGVPTSRQWRRLAMPFVRRDLRVRHVKDIPYVDGGGPRQRLDIYRPDRDVSGAPVLVYIHGGGWIIGDKREQGLPMMLHLAANGWVCVTINYRLSPKVAFPEHLLDCKRALAWTMQHIGEYGGDPRQVVVSGGSAGGHLASLVALTAGRSDLQVGFEEIDLSVRAAVPFYGVYDFTKNGIHGRGFGRFIVKTVLQTTPEANPELFALASPMHHVGADAPPFLIIHGANDTLVPVEEARAFASLLRDRSTSTVAYAELPGAQHAFEVFRSIRAAEVVPRVETFLRSVLHLETESADGVERG